MPTYRTILTQDVHLSYLHTSLVRSGLPCDPITQEEKRIDRILDNFGLFYGGTIVEVRQVRRRDHPVVTVLLGNGQELYNRSEIGLLSRMQNSYISEDGRVLYSDLDTTRLLELISRQGSNYTSEYSQYLKKH